MAKKVKAKIKEIDKKIKEKKKDKAKKNEKKAKKKVSLRFVLANMLTAEEVYTYKPESKKSHNVFTRTEKTVPVSEFETLSVLVPAKAFDTPLIKKFITYLEKDGVLMDVPSPYDGEYAKMFNSPMVRITSKYKPELLNQDVVKMSVIVDLTRKDSSTIYRILFSSETDGDNLSWKKFKI